MSSLVSSSSAAGSPSMLHRPPRRSVRSPPGPKRSSPRGGAHDRLAVGVVGAVDDEIDALERERRLHHAGRAARHPRPSRAGRPGPSATPGTARSRARSGLAAVGRKHVEAVERGEQVDLSLYLRLRVVGAHDHGVILQERVRSPAGVHQTLELTVSLGERRDLGAGPVAMRVGVVVGQREQQEVEQVVLHQERPDAARVAVPQPRHAERGLAAGAPGREQVGVEELARPQDGLAEDLRRQPGEGRLVVGLVLVPAAVHEVGRARRAHVGVVERLEHRRRVG